MCVTWPRFQTREGKDPGSLPTKPGKFLFFKWEGEKKKCGIEMTIKQT